jgi:hypothetical protein
MITIYRLNVNELSTEILNSIKEAFKGKTVEIIVTEATDETNYLLQSEANKKMLMQSISELEAGEGITLTLNELEAKYGK